MNINLFLTDDDQQSKEYKYVLNHTNKLQEQRKNDRSESTLGDSYFRSCALRLAQQGDYTQAIALLTQLIFRHPHNVACVYNSKIG